MPTHQRARQGTRLPRPSRDRTVPPEVQLKDEAAEAYKDAAVCYKKTNPRRAIEHYKEAVQIHIDTGNSRRRRSSKEIAELHEAEQPERGDGGLPAGGRSLCGRGRDVPTKPVLVQGGGLAAQTPDHKKAIELYEQVAMTSLESTLPAWSVKDHARGIATSRR